MAVELATVLSSGELTNIFLGGTDPANEVLVLADIQTLLSGGTITEMFIGGTDPDDEVLLVGDLLPSVSSLLSGGSFTQIQLGSPPGLTLSHNATDGFLTANLGDMHFNSASGALVFQTAGVDKWTIDSAGNLIPTVAAAYELGSTLYELKNIFLGDSCNLYFGDGPDMRAYHNGSNGYVTCSTGVLSIGTISTASLGFIVNNVQRWYVINSGHLLPNLDNTYNIGSATLCVNTVYYYSLSSCSDERKKTDIQPSIGLDFISKLDPISFKFKADINDNNKKRHGLSAQQLKNVLDSDNIEFSGILYDEVEDLYSLDYLQFIGPIIQAIKDLNELLKNKQDK